MTDITGGGGPGLSSSGGAASGANSTITSLTGLTTPLSVPQGGSGTSTPGLVAGTGVTVTGPWPNQTINSSGGGLTSAAVSAVAAANYSDLDGVL